jgi:ferredoxin
MAVHSRPPDAPDKAGWASSRPSGKATTPSTWTCARAATPASTSAPKAPSAWTTRWTWHACKKHRDCVRVCDAAGAIDFSRAPLAHSEDLRPGAGPAQHTGLQPAPVAAGLLSPGRDERALVDAVLKLREMTGEFDKPRFFRYDAKICAHSRNEKTGCKACIDVCSASAIRSDGSRKGKTRGRPRAAWWWTRICAWAAVPVPPSAPAVPWPLPTPARWTRANACAPCSPPTAMPAAATRRC